MYDHDLDDYEYIQESMAEAMYPEEEDSSEE